MIPIEALDFMEGALVERGVALATSNGLIVGDGGEASTAWEVFRSMASQSVTETFVLRGEQVRVCGIADDDLLLHESGLSGRNGTFEINFTRFMRLSGADDEYAGTVTCTLTLVSRSVPTGRVPQARRWGYAGERRAEVDDFRHPEMKVWAGHLTGWADAVQKSRSFSAIARTGAASFTLDQADV